jgi:hypothetical protein
VLINYESEVGLGDLFAKNGVMHFVKSVIKNDPPPAEDAVTVFVTKIPNQGNFGALAASGDGLEGADAYCQEAAMLAGLTGTWKAWLSTTGENAFSRIPDGEYRLVDETLVANDKNELTVGTLKVPINLNEYGESNSTSVWSGTKPDGTVWMDTVGNISTCDNWTNNDSNTSCAAGEIDCAVLGNSASADGAWSLNGGQSSPMYSPCSGMRSLYCFGR